MALQLMRETRFIAGVGELGFRGDLDALTLISSHLANNTSSNKASAKHLCVPNSQAAVSTDLFEYDWSA